MRELCKNFMLQAYKPRLSLTTDCRENQQLLTHGDGCLCWIIRKLPLSSKIWFAFSFYLKQNLNLQNLQTLLLILVLFPVSNRLELSCSYFAWQHFLISLRPRGLLIHSLLPHFRHSVSVMIKQVTTSIIGSRLNSW